MDLVKIAPSWLLHMICVFTKLSAAAVVADKTSKCSQQCFLMSWLAHYGVPREIRTDIGPEFDSQSMRTLCERLGIEVTTAPGEAHWTMGVIERQHETLRVAVFKHMTEGLSLDEALALMTTAMRWHELKGGSSPFQLVFGRGTSLPNYLNDGSGAMGRIEHAKSEEEYLTKDLEYLLSARAAVYEAESKARLDRAYRMKARKVEFNGVIGDMVQFWRTARTKGLTGWHGPAEVLGQGKSTVFVRFGGSVLRVHPLHVRHIRGDTDREEEDPPPEGSDEEQDADEFPDAEELTTEEEEFCTNMVELKAEWERIKPQGAGMAEEVACMQERYKQFARARRTDIPPSLPLEMT